MDLARRRIYGVGGNVDGAGRRGNARVETGGVCTGCFQQVGEIFRKCVEEQLLKLI